MQIKYKILKHQIEFTFTISRSSANTCSTVIVWLMVNYKGEEYIGIGEAVFYPFYGETLESVCAFYDELSQSEYLEGLDIFDVEEFELRIANFNQSLKHKKNQAAKAGLDTALYDLRAKILKQPLYEFLGLDASKAPKTSYTIGIADLDTVKKKVLVALERGYDILKVKLGSAQDLETLRLIRSLAPELTIRVDANAAWELSEAIKMLNIIKDYDIEFVEEPLKLGSSKDDYLKLKEESPLILMADESCHTFEDISFCAEYFQAINLKLSKTGGISEALKMIKMARAQNLKIMLGCFTETNVSISAFAHISPLVDYADLDGSLLLANDPFKNNLFQKNQIKLLNKPGLGIPEGAFMILENL